MSRATLGDVGTGDRRAVQSAMGHSTAATTEIYLHSTHERTAEVSAAVERALGLPGAVHAQAGQGVQAGGGYRPICSGERCERFASVRGLCRKHYQTARNRGELLTVEEEATVERLEENGVQTSARGVKK